MGQHLRDEGVGLLHVRHQAAERVLHRLERCGRRPLRIEQRFALLPGETVRETVMVGVEGDALPQGEETLPVRLQRPECRPTVGRIEDQKSVVKGKSVSVRVDLGGRRIIKKKTENTTAHKKKEQIQRTYT